MLTLCLFAAVKFCQSALLVSVYKFQFFFVALIVHVRMHACVCVCTRCRQKLIAAACMLFCLTAASWHVSAADTALLPSTMANSPLPFLTSSHIPLIFCSVQSTSLLRIVLVDHSSVTVKFLLGLIEVLYQLHFTGCNIQRTETYKDKTQTERTCKRITNCVFLNKTNKTTNYNAHTTT